MSSTGYMFLPTVKWAGYWEFVPAPTSFRVSSIKKPCWFHRKMVKLCFGWTWHDGPAI